MIILLTQSTLSYRVLFIRRCSWIVEFRELVGDRVGSGKDNVMNEQSREMEKELLTRFELVEMMVQEGRC